MVSPIKVQADLSEGLNAWLTLVPDGLRAIGTRLAEEYDYRRDSRRMRNIAETAALALPNMNADAAAPDDDWLTEWFDLASKRSRAEWQHALANMLAAESNDPGSVPLRYFADMARLDKEVLAEFEEYCGYYILIWDVRYIVRQSKQKPKLIVEANLVDHAGLGDYRSDLPENIHNINPDAPCFLLHPVPDVCIPLNNGKYRLPAGNIQLTNFGRFVYSLLDPKPPPAPDLAQSLRALWQEHLYEGDLTG